MKFQVQLKDPDGFSDSIDDAIAASLKAMTEIDEDEKDAVKEKRGEKVREAMEKWVEYGEYVTLEFDTDAGTAIVVERK